MADYAIHIENYGSGHHLSFRFDMRIWQLLFSIQRKREK
jgi:hypothetical protein